MRDILHPDHSAVGHPDHREQNRRIMRPEGGICVAHQLAAPGITQVRQLGAERVDRRKQPVARDLDEIGRSDAHTSEFQSLMRISYAVFCLSNKKLIFNDSSFTSL